MAGVDNVMSLLSILYQHCENVTVLKEYCGRLRNIIGVNHALLLEYLREMRGKPLPPWVGELEKALHDGIDKVKKIKSSPMKAKMFPASYKSTLEDVRIRIHDAMEAIALTNAIVGEQQKRIITNMARALFVRACVRGGRAPGLHEMMTNGPTRA